MQTYTPLVRNVKRWFDPAEIGGAGRLTLREPQGDMKIGRVKTRLYYKASVFVPVSSLELTRRTIGRSPGPL